MELRLDCLLSVLRERPAEVLAAIDADPLLLKKEVDGLVLANASKELYTPRQEHQLFAKGIVYRRAPYRLVSLPLVKIYNVGEHGVTIAELTRLAQEPGVRLNYLRKVDGSLIQVFRADGKVRFTTRGLLEGIRVISEDEDAGFDYLGAARRLAETRYRSLLEEEALLAGRTLLFELIHPAARKVTNYGARDDLILLTVFDQRQIRYPTHAVVAALGARYGLTVADALTPRGATLAEEVDDLLASLADSDQEGSVLSFERADEVIYRVKVKSPAYLRLMRAMAECTYDRTRQWIETHPDVTTWPQLEEVLRGLGRERMPEEVLPYFRSHCERYLAYRADCARLAAELAERCRQLRRRIDPTETRPAASYRKEYAALVEGHPLSALLFAAFDGRLDVTRVMRQFDSIAEVRTALAQVAG